MVREDHAEYAVACTVGDRCAGTLVVRSLAGKEYGRASFDVPRLERLTLTVPLTALGVAALRAGAIAQIHVLPVDDSQPPGGCRIAVTSPGSG